MDLIGISLKIGGVEHVVMSAGPLYVPFGEACIQVLCSFFHRIVCLSGADLYKFFPYFGN